jgi:hypothetical protein
MARIASITGAFYVVAFAWLAPVPAGAAQLFVSQFGNDSGNGTAFQPLLTLQAAINAANDGDVIQLEMGGNYGPGVINNKTLSIISFDGGGIFEPGGTALTFNSGNGSDTLTLRGLMIDQGGSNNHGIVFNSGRKLDISNTTIQNGRGPRVAVFHRPNSNSEVNIRNTTINEFGTSGIGGAVRIEPRNGADVKGTFSNNTFNNSSTGIASTAGSGGTVDLFVIDNVIAGGGTGISSSGVDSRVRIRNSTITGNSAGLQSQSSGQILTGGFNTVVNNSLNDPTGTYAVK